MFNRGKFNRFGFNRLTVSSTPLVNIISVSKIKISDEATMDSSEVIFSVDRDFDLWEARATKSPVEPAIGVGFVVGSGGAALLNQSISFYIDDEELNSGEGSYTVTIYINDGGVWYG